MMSAWFARLATVLIAVVSLQQPTAPRGGCPRCGWTPPQGKIVDVRNVIDLERAVSSVRSGETILMAEGVYALRRTLEISTPHVTIRGRSGNASDVVLRGRGMTGDPVGVAMSVGAPDVTIADLTIREVGYHAVQVRGESGASRFTLHNAHLEDTGQQLLKGSVSEQRVYADDGLVACSVFSYTAHAPSNYTNGVDILATSGWVIRDNRFARIRGPESDGWKAGPSILAWAAARDTIVERNVILDSYRGIALGLVDTPNQYARDGERVYDHAGGRVRNNIIVNLSRWADEPIEANAARDTRIDHNTVFVEGSAPWSISVRFPAADALVRNNLTNHRVFLRDGGRATLNGNVTSARRTWFVDLPKADLHLAPGGRPAIDAGVPIADVTADFDRVARPSGRAPDAGAYEAGLPSPGRAPERRR